MRIRPGRDAVTNQRWGIAPSLAFGIGTPTRVTSITRIWIRTTCRTTAFPWVPNTNVPLRAYADQAPPVDFSNFYGLTSRDYEDTKTDVGDRARGTRLQRRAQPAVDRPGRPHEARFADHLAALRKQHQHRDPPDRLEVARSDGRHRRQPDRPDVAIPRRARSATPWSPASKLPARRRRTGTASKQGGTAAVDRSVRSGFVDTVREPPGSRRRGDRRDGAFGGGLRLRHRAVGAASWK